MTTCIKTEEREASPFVVEKRNILIYFQETLGLFHYITKKRINRVRRRSSEEIVHCGHGANNNNNTDDDNDKNNNNKKQKNRDRDRSQATDGGTNKPMVEVTALKIAISVAITAAMRWLLFSNQHFCWGAVFVMAWIVAVYMIENTGLYEELKILEAREVDLTHDIQVLKSGLSVLVTEKNLIESEMFRMINERSSDNDNNNYSTTTKPKKRGGVAISRSWTQYRNPVTGKEEDGLIVREGDWIRDVPRVRSSKSV